MIRLFTLLAVAFVSRGNADMPKIALLYSDFRLSDRTFMDDHAEELGWPLDCWSVDELPEFMDAIGRYDFVIVSPCWNYTPGNELKRDKDHGYPRASMSAGSSSTLQPERGQPNSPA